jgi:nanoRNase/pAp phosphatase (c-di-AMP/oligoRNAs hydrolase)
MDWQPLWDIIRSNDRFVISSHVRPDADAIGSELALAELLDGMGKSVRIINPSAPPGTLEFLDPGSRLQKFGDSTSSKDVRDTDVHLIVDTSAWTQLQGVGDAMKTSNAVKVVIDHHVSSDNLGAIEFKDTVCEATGTLIYRFLKSGDITITPSMARNLFCAITTDTGWFRFSSTTAETMRIGANLIDLGVKPDQIFRLLYEQRSYARIQLAGRILSKVKLDSDGQLAYTSVDRNDFVVTSAAPVDTEGLVNECLTIAGTEAAFIAVELENRGIKVSFRSRGGLDVAAIAEQFNGGGHKQASGATLKGPLIKAVGQVLKAMNDGLSAIEFHASEPSNRMN